VFSAAYPAEGVNEGAWQCRVLWELAARNCFLAPVSLECKSDLFLPVVGRTVLEVGGSKGTACKVWFPADMWFETIVAV
jgi:hypothetical protein